MLGFVFAYHIFALFAIFCSIQMKISFVRLLNAHVSKYSSVNIKCCHLI